MDRRGSLAALALGAVSVFVGKPAWATLARALRIEELAGRSRHVLLGEPLDAHCVWEHVAGRRQIVTYTRVRAHEVVAGSDPQDSELQVRTLGGRVGELGQLVHGEAQLVVGARSVVFLVGSGLMFAVTAMAQGHYPLRRDLRGLERLRKSPALPELVARDGSAVERLSERTVTEARRLLHGLVNK
jgi:hypothetical protein